MHNTTHTATATTYSSIDTQSHTDTIHVTAESTLDTQLQRSLEEISKSYQEKKVIMIFIFCIDTFSKNF